MARMKYFEAGEKFRLDEFPGGSFNRHGRAAEWVEKFAQRQPNFEPPQEKTWVWVDNQTGQDVPAGGVLEIGPSRADREALGMQAYEGKVPSSDTFGDGKFCIALNACRDGRCGRFAVAGLVRCNVYIPNSDLVWLDVEPGSVDKLVSHPAGRAKVVDGASLAGDTRTWILLNVAGPTTWRAIPKQDIQPDSLGPVDIFGKLLTTPVSVLPAVHLDWMHGNAQLDRGTQSIVEWFPHEAKWRFTHAACDTVASEVSYQNSVGTGYSNKDGAGYGTPPLP